jgi:hypothetical protein
MIGLGLCAVVAFILCGCLLAEGYILGRKVSTVCGALSLVAAFVMMIVFTNMVDNASMGNPCDSTSKKLQGKVFKVLMVKHGTIFLEEHLGGGRTYLCRVPKEQKVVPDIDAYVMFIDGKTQEVELVEDSKEKPKILSPPGTVKPKN